MSEKKADRVPVCTVDKQMYYGKPIEEVAAKLKQGDEILFNGERRVVDYVWFYDGIVVSLAGGKTLHLSTGDTFELMANTPEG